MVLTRTQSNVSPPLDPEVEGVFVEEEEVVEEEVHSAEIMTNEGKGYTDHDKVEYIKIIQPLFYDITKNMTRHRMKVFKLLSTQMGSKGVIGDSSISQSEEKKTMGEHIFSRTEPHNICHDFQSTPRPTVPKFIIRK